MLFFSEKLQGVIPHVPFLLRMQLGVTPKVIQKQVLAVILNRVFKEALQEQELDFLQGRYLAIDVKDIGYYVTITVNSDKLYVVDQVVADVVLTANFNDLVLMVARLEDPDSLFFQRKLNIEGDTALGLNIKNWLDTLELDLLPSWCHHLLMDYAKLI